MNQTTTLQVNDMHCDSCPKIITMDLQDKPGVVSVNASLDTKTVTVEYDPALVTVNDLITTIKDSGYTATSL